MRIIKGKNYREVKTGNIKKGDVDEFGNKYYSLVGLPIFHANRVFRKIKFKRNILVFSNDQKGIFNNEIAFREGWGIFIEKDKYVIQKLDKPNSIDKSYPKKSWFKTDKEARNFVEVQAKYSTYHSKALDVTNYIRELSFDDVVGEITDALNVRSQGFIANIYKQVCDSKIKYIGDNIFKQDIR